LGTIVIDQKTEMDTVNYLFKVSTLFFDILGFWDHMKKDPPSCTEQQMFPLSSSRKCINFI